VRFAWVIQYFFMSTGEKFEKAVQIMARLRAPGGCPWDREQTFDSITKYTLEETYEVLEAIESRNWDELVGELGDLLLQVLFYSEMAREEGRFSINDVLDRLAAKLVHRHPHVFGDASAGTPAEALRNWEALKSREREAKRAAGNNDEGPQGHLDSVSHRIPALMEATKISAKAAHAGFDWPGIEGVFEKLAEETAELQQHTSKLQPAGQPGSPPKISPDIREHLEEELGDLFFVLVNLARFLQVDPESALRRTNRKFRARFGFMEQQLKEQGMALQDAGMEQMESLWQQAKTREKQ